MYQSLLNEKFWGKLNFRRFFWGETMKSGPVVVSWSCLINSAPQKIHQNHFQGVYNVSKPFEWENSGENRILGDFFWGQAQQLSLGLAWSIAYPKKNHKNHFQKVQSPLNAKFWEKIEISMIFWGWDDIVRPSSCLLTMPDQQFTPKNSSKSFKEVWNVSKPFEWENSE